MEDLPPTKKPKLVPAGGSSPETGLPDSDRNSSTGFPDGENMPGLTSSGDMSGLPGPSNGQPEDSSTHNQDDDDNISVMSGMSDMSGKGWKPDMSGGMTWLARARARGVDPRDIISDLLQEGDAHMLNQMDDNTIWMILAKMLAQPPRREKLRDFNTLEDVATHIKNATNILVLTGAGVSVSCGIPDFRSKDGVYARLAVDFPDLPDPQAMFDIQYFRKDPRPFFKFAKEIYPGQFTPSPCHKFIQCLEKEGKLLRNYTQNIDTLEQVAGISRVVQCHGSFATATCTVCRQKKDAEIIREDIMQQKIPLCPTCPSPNLQEILDELHKQQEERKEAERKRLEEISKLAASSETDEPSTSVKPAGAIPGTSGGTSLPENLPESQTSSTGQESSTTNDQPSSSKQAEEKSNTERSSSPSSSPVPASSNQNSSPLPTDIFAAIPKASVSPFTDVPIMKPDIVFFGEGLSDQFHNTISLDKDKVDLLIVIGSSLKVRPVALIPSSIPKHIPQVLINRERLSHMTFDVELLGDCDVVINQLCHMLEGDWSPSIHRPLLEQTMSLPQLPDDKQEGEEDGLDADKPGPSSQSAADRPGTSSSSASDKPGPSSQSAADKPGPSSQSATDSIASSATTSSEPASKVVDDGVKEDKDGGGDAEMEGDGGEVDKEGEEEDQDDWKPKSIAESLPHGKFLHIPPHRYIFSGAEVYFDDISEDEEELSEDDDEVPDSEEPREGEADLQEPRESMADLQGVEQMEGDEDGGR